MKNIRFDIVRKQILVFTGIITTGLIFIFTLLLPAVAAEEAETNSTAVNYKNKHCLNQQGIIKPKIAEQIIKEKAQKVIKAIACRNFNKLSNYIHPEKGVRFSPYTYVRIEKDVVFTKKQVNNFFNNDKIYLWGHYDGSGKEIRLSPKEYYHQFIYTDNFINADKIGYNEVLSSSNMIKNQFEVYENPIIVEYYFSDTKTKYDGMNWKSLSLVFEKYKSKWMLRGIIHNQWTI
ncbi:hypothetical protein [Halanaerobium sp. ST460_2HS_T2]|jgi:hypothetical protein|uniref:hypothetical protein n=1 Tax=Halanaerobium sp. ST460_2HS_T2 TaxID=2183914 RepID=UPI000DF14EAB|nr:hypothetical protein [Halanaerobium sp. ST460_2HS_T2]RCW51619.1 hypothetical protein DFR80_13915 [Halanaerobium sp. ST460_2HS_T2]